MTVPIPIIISFFAGALIAVGITLIVVKLRSLDERISALESGKRQPHPTDAAFMDLAANAIEFLFDLDAEEGRLHTRKLKLDEDEGRLDARRQRVNRFLDIIGEARQGPRAYGKSNDHGKK